jgi:mannose-6-phosphate isomerase-like protein (cupin superfamily)
MGRHGLIRSPLVDEFRRSAVDAHELSEVATRRAASGDAYLEFVRRPDISVGIYVLPAGGVDRQSPHTEDEVYYVVGGRALITVGEETREVRPGSVVYVAASVPHRFHGISEELTLLVVFGPAEGSREAAS